MHARSREAVVYARDVGTGQCEIAAPEEPRTIASCLPSMADDSRRAVAERERTPASDDASEDAHREVHAEDGRLAGEVTPPTAAIAVAPQTPMQSGRAPRKRKPPIDIDEHIAAARKSMKDAQKRVTAARAQARNERRKKQRLMKKAAALTAEDLERIAVLKRCGLDRMDNCLEGGVSSAASTAASSSAGGTAANSGAA